MKHWFLLLSVIAAVGMLTSCGGGKCEQRGFTELEFDLPVKITPSRDTFRIGDTIWIENSFDDMLVNQNSNKSYRVQNFDFGTNLTITDLNSPPIAISYKNPIIITVEGTTTGTNIGTVDYQTIYVDYDYTQNRYRYKAAFILDRSGFYLIAFSSHSSGRRDIDITDCPDERITNTYNTNDRVDNNYMMIKNAVDPHYKNLPEEMFNDAGGYCFYVK